MLTLAAEIPPEAMSGLTDDRWQVIIAVLALALLSVGFMTGRRL